MDEDIRYFVEQTRDVATGNSRGTEAKMKRAKLGEDIVDADDITSGQVVVAAVANASQCFFEVANEPQREIYACSSMNQGWHVHFVMCALNREFS